MKSVRGRTVLITGGAMGMGRLFAERAVAEGAATVILWDVNEPALNETLEDLADERVAVVGYVVDLTSKDEIEVTAAEVLEQHALVDVLINNAGIVAYAETESMSDAEWDAMIGINLTGPFRVARAAIPHLKRSEHGVIVNNSSVMGLRGGNRLAHYVASKHGLTGLTKAWAIELAPFGVRVVSVHPTGVNTPMNDGLAELEGATALEIAERSAGNLLPGVPWIEAGDVAELVLWLVSDRARYATGSQFVLDAGLLTR